MNFYRQTIKNIPSVFQVPSEFRNRNVEVIILPLDESENGQQDQIERDEMGYPIGFFEATAGSIPDFPERDQPPMQEREAIDP